MSLWLSCLGFSVEFSVSVPCPFFLHSVTVQVAATEPAFFTSVPSLLALQFLVLFLPQKENIGQFRLVGPLTQSSAHN